MFVSIIWFSFDFQILFAFLRISVLYHMTNMTILDILFFNFSNSTKSMSSEAITPLKTISDDSIWHPKGHPSIPRKSQNLQFLGFGPCLVPMDSICMLWRHVSAVETWYMLYGHGTCLLVGEEYVLLLEKNRCLLVGEE